jgi:hypothetical protein
MIRQATIQDYDDIMAMMINFANSSPYNALQQPQYNDTYIRRLLDSFSKEGCILLGIKDNKPVSMLIAQIQSDAWLPEIKTMKEVAWWVEPEHRHSSLGYRLLKEYVNIGKTLVDKKIIEGFTLTNMEISPDFDLEKRGWRPIETNYIYEGV